MTLLSIPALAFAFFGSRTPELEQDGLGLYRFSLGNIGYDKTSPTFEADSACKSAVPTNINGTCIHLASLEFTATDASNILTACEFLSVCVFLLFVHRLRVKSKKLMKDNENDECTVRDYTIVCTNLPVDTTPTDLLIHFNKWQLETKDWNGRYIYLENLKGRGYTRLLLTGCRFIDGLYRAVALRHDYHTQYGMVG